MRWMLAVAAVGTLAGCPADDVPGVDGALDGSPDAVDAALLECPVVDPPERPASTLPTGAWWGAWSCVSGCDLPAPALVAAARVELGQGVNSYADWRTQTAQIERTPMADDGTCWRVAADANGCRAAFDVCGIACAGGGDCVVVPLATWTDLATGRQQTWRFDGDRFL